MENLKRSIPGKAKATILLPQDQINRTVVATFIPGTQGHESKRCFIGNISSEDDVADIENFDEALKRIRKKEKRIITIQMHHDAEKFKMRVLFSFVGNPNNAGESFEVETDASGKTYFQVLAEL